MIKTSRTNPKEWWVHVFSGLALWQSQNGLKSRQGRDCCWTVPRCFKDHHGGSYFQRVGHWGFVAVHATKHPTRQPTNQLQTETIHIIVSRWLIEAWAILGYDPTQVLFLFPWSLSNKSGVHWDQLPTLLSGFPSIGNGVFYMAFAFYIILHDTPNKNACDGSPSKMPYMKMDAVSAYTKIEHQFTFMCRAPGGNAWSWVTGNHSKIAVKVSWVKYIILPDSL